jgi:hypothetical protein
MDILFVRKYDSVMYELDNNLVYDQERLEIIHEETETDESYSTDDEGVEETKQERNFDCLWDDVDEQGREIPCTFKIIPSTTGELPDYCPKHIEEHNKWLDMLEYYIKDTLKMIEPVVIKKINKESPGWKKMIQEELGMTQYLLKKTIDEQHKLGSDIRQIAVFLDAIDNE